MNEFEPRPTNAHLDLERLRMTGARFASHIEAGTTAALEQRREIDTDTARGIAHVLGRAFGRASHLARFGREGEGRYEDLREEYLQLYREPRLSPGAHEWIDWLGAHLVARDGVGAGARDTARPQLPLLLVRTQLLIADQIVVAHVAAAHGASEIDGLTAYLHELQITEDEALRAFVGLPDIDAMAGNVMEHFHESFAGTYPNSDAALRVLSPLQDWEAELVEWRMDRGIEDDALEFNTAPLIERLRLVYELVETPGGVHAFYK